MNYYNEVTMYGIIKVLREATEMMTTKEIAIAANIDTTSENLDAIRWELREAYATNESIAIRIRRVGRKSEYTYAINNWK